MSIERTLGFLMGLGCGVAVGVLCAPRSGIEIRRLLTAKTKESAETVKGRTNDLLDSANTLVDKGRAEFARQQEGFKNAVEAGKKAYQETTGVVSVS